MNPDIHSILPFLQEEKGPTSVEYAVLVFLVIVFCIGAISAFGQRILQSLTNSNNLIQAMTGS